MECIIPWQWLSRRATPARKAHRGPFRAPLPDRPGSALARPFGRVSAAHVQGRLRRGRRRRAAHRLVDSIDLCRNADDDSSQGAVTRRSHRRKCSSSKTSRHRANEDSHHERHQATRLLLLCRMSRQILHLRLPALRGLPRQRRKQLVRLRPELLLRPSLHLRQQVISNGSRGATRGTTRSLPTSAGTGARTPC